MRWTIVRLSTFSIWPILAALLIRYRKHPVNWRSFSYSSIATIIIAKVVSSSLVSGSANVVIIAGAIVFYALVPGEIGVRHAMNQWNIVTSSKDAKDQMSSGA